VRSPEGNDKRRKKKGTTYSDNVNDWIAVNTFSIGKDVT